MTSYTPATGFTLIDGTAYYPSVRAYKTTNLTSTTANGNQLAVVTATPTLNFNFMSGSTPMTSTNSSYPSMIQFSRASGANVSPGTYYNSSGVITSAPQNLISKSQVYGAAPWTTGDASITANATTAPDGSTTASHLTEGSDSSNNYHDLIWGMTLTSGTTYCFSVYMKAAERTYGQIQLGNNAYTNQYIRIDLNSGTISATGNGTIAAYGISSAGNGWYRPYICGTASGNLYGSPLIFPTTGNVNPLYTGDGTSGIYVWGAQFEAGSTPSSYIYTTTAAAYGPRFDYNPSTLALNGLLIEEQRTNLVPSSESFTSGCGCATITASAATAPDGSGNASKIVENTANSRHYSGKTATLTAGAAYSYSVYLKAAERTQALIYAGKSGSPFTRGGMIVNLANGTFSNSDSGTPTSVTNRSVTSLQNGWYRVNMTVVIDGSSTDGYMEIDTYYNGQSTYTGDGASGIYVWGAQIEQGAMPTSYIPTTTVAMTRNTDRALVPTSSGSWFSNTQGTLYGTFKIPSFQSNQFIFDLDDGTGNNRIGVYATSTGGVVNNAITAGVAQFQPFWANALTANAVSKVALSYQSNNYGGATNGNVQTSGSGSVPTVTQLQLGAYAGGSFYANGWLQTIQYFNSNLGSNVLSGHG